MYSSRTVSQYGWPIVQLRRVQVHSDPRWGLVRVEDGVSNRNRRSGLS